MVTNEYDSFSFGNKHTRGKVEQMSLFVLSAHVLGRTRAVSCESDGFGLTLTIGGEPRRVSNVREAIRLARDDIGTFLRRADTREKPWGLHMSAGGVSASYGSPAPGTVSFPVLSGPPADPNSLVARIRARYNDDNGTPMEALANAIEIIRAYTERSDRRAA